MPVLVTAVKELCRYFGTLPAGWDASRDSLSNSEAQTRAALEADIPLHARWRAIVGLIVESLSTYSPRIPTAAWNDDELVEECLRGNELAWSAIVDKYKGMVYCAAMKHQFSAREAADLFQEVWSDLYPELRRLTKPGALVAWLIPVVWHKCNRRALTLLDKGTPAREIPFDDWREHAQRVQVFRDAVSQLPECCRRMVRLLFQWDPPLKYADAASQIALSESHGESGCKGCLDRLRRVLEQRGF